jgi:predicted DNA-binding transcriptional regulator AlpA
VDGSYVRQFSHGRSKTVVVTKVRRRVLSRSIEPDSPASGGAQCGVGEKAEPPLENQGTSHAHAALIAPVPILGNTGSAISRADSGATLPPSANQLPPDSRRLLTEAAVAARLSLSPATLRNWRVRGFGPPFVRLSRRAVRYEAEVVDNWIAVRARRSTGDEGGANG